MNTKTINTKAVNSTELRIGDIVHSHGARLKLVSCYCGPAEAERNAKAAAAHCERHSSCFTAYQVAEEIERTINCRGFRTENLGPVDADRPGLSYPIEVQGNHRMVWAVEVAA